MKRVDLLKHPVAFIESMMELKKRYEAALELGISKTDYEYGSGMKCLLCNPIGIDISHRELAFGSGHSAACAKLGCPWVVITGMICDEWSRMHLNDEVGECNFIPTTVYNSSNPMVIGNRIKQLEEWIEIYIAHRDSRILP